MLKLNLYIVRHGTTVWNEQKRTQGRVNNRLSSKGKIDAYALAEDLKKVKFDFIFCSPLTRAVQTANIINVYQNLKIIKDERITDIDQGVFSGRYYDSLTPSELVAKNCKDKACKIESLEEMYFRVKKFYDYLVENFKEKTVLVVTHSGVASFLEKMVSFPNYSKEEYSRTDLFKKAQVKSFFV